MSVRILPKNHNILVKNFSVTPSCAETFFMPRAGGRRGSLGIFTSQEDFPVGCSNLPAQSLCQHCWEHTQPPFLASFLPVPFQFFKLQQEGAFIR